MTPTPLPDRCFEAFLFDMDGTILSSLAAAERVWAAWARRFGLDVATFLPTMHGRRAVETIRRLALPGVNAEAEAATVTASEMLDVEGIEAIAGAAAFLASLPAHRWAIVTSAPRDLALRRISAAALPVPTVMVTADDVERGKPAPDCFVLAAKRLGVPVERCLVFEDAPAGIAAAEAAGAALVVISATHGEVLATPHPLLPGYEGVTCKAGAQGALQLVLRA